MHAKGDFSMCCTRHQPGFGYAATAVSEWPAAIFLQDIVPKRMPLSELIKRLRDTEQRQNGEDAP